MPDNNPIEHIRGFHAELTELRHTIHANPELGLEEHRTAELVAKKLTELGIEVHTGVGATGVVGVLRVGDGSQKIGLRADMDALPIDEKTNLAYSSRNAGRMHACGHDGHTTMLLGAARYLAETRNFDGTVHFIFQPAEEGIGGALAMLKDRLFERFPCDAVYGMHNRPGMPVGKFAIRARAGDGRRRVLRHHRRRARARTAPGRRAASIRCSSPATSSPRCNRSSRATCPPADTAVLSVTQMHGRRRLQRHSGEAMLRGTVRAMRRETHGHGGSRMRRIAERHRRRPRRHRQRRFPHHLRRR